MSALVVGSDRWATATLATMMVKEQLDRPDATGTGWRRLTIGHDGIDAIMVTIGDVPLYVRGPKAGSLNYRATTNSADRIVPLAEPFYDWCRRLRHRTGLCLQCAGTGDRFVSWHHITGTVMRPCPGCQEVPA